MGRLPSAGSPLTLKGCRPQAVPSQGIGSNGPRPRVKEPWTVWLASALQLNVQVDRGISHQSLHAPVLVEVAIKC